MRRYLAAGALAVLAYYTVPGIRGEWPLYSAVGLSAAAAIVVGIRRYRPPAASAWWLFAVAETVAVVGDIVLFSVHGAFPSVADVFYLASYPLLAGGLVILLRSQSRGGDVAGLLDAAMVTVGLGLLAWVFLMEPYTRQRGISVLEKAVSISYPLMDVLLLGVAVRLAMGFRTRSVAWSLLASSIVLLLATDIAYGVVQVTRGYGDSTYLDVGWLASYLLMGAAALHPSMRTLTERSREAGRELGGWRLLLLGAVLLLAPAVEAVEGRWQGNGSPVVWAGSAALSILVLARMAYLVQRLRAAVAGYQQAERVKDEFVSTVSHELRTPLTSILGHLEILSDGGAGALQPDQIHMLGVVDRNSRRLLHLIEDLLTLSNVEGKTLRTTIAPTQLDNLVAGVASAVSVDAANRGVAFDVVVDPNLGTAMVDGTQIDRVLLNLVSNALKFTMMGGRVTLSARRSADDIVLAVSDTGIGIRAEDQPFLFNRFFRSTAATSLAIPGTGLGLSIVKAIVDEHHGSIEVESEEGVGTTVTLRIPAGTGAPDASRAARPARIDPAPTSR